MKYVHYTQPNGDSIAKTLLKLRAQYGDAWTDKMASYAIGKTRCLPSISWREPATSGVPYIRHQYVQINAE